MMVVILFRRSPRVSSRFVWTPLFLAPPTTGGPRGASGPITGAAPPPGALIPEGYKPSNPADAAIASNAKKFVKIPTKYKFEDQTDLSYEVKAGPQTYDIDLK